MEKADGTQEKATKRATKRAPSKTKAKKQEQRYVVITAPSGTNVYEGRSRYGHVVRVARNGERHEFKGVDDGYIQTEEGFVRCEYATVALG